MTQEERRIYLIQALMREDSRYRGIKIPRTEGEQKNLLRSLMNLRPPKPAKPEYLTVQDAYLSEEIKSRGITEVSSLPPANADGRLFLWKGDITSLRVDAIVNAANSTLLGCFQPCHPCIDNVIHSYSGVQLRLACQEIMESQGHSEPAGTAKITPAFNLLCKYVLHTVGPTVFGPVTKQDCELLAGCYHSCLELAVKHEVHSVAFCCIATGVFHFPQEKAAQIAVKTVSQFLEQNSSLRQIVFNVFTDKDLSIYRQLLRR